MASEKDKESGSLTTAKDSFENELKDHDQHASVKTSLDKVEEGPPSRHLWVGNVASTVTKAQLSEQFSRFGDLENVAEYPSRNYAFVNYKNKEDAVYAKKGLQGTVLGGSAIRIEFAKGNSKGEGHHRTSDTDDSLDDELDIDVSPTKGSERHKRDRDREEPSETLWVGFPLCMKMDERKLHKAFSPFGAVQRITTFPGRTYAFVEFHSIKAASRAKNVLQGKLFNDPRVSISFAKSEIGPVEQQQRLAGPILSPPPAVHDMPPILLPKPGSFVNPRNDRYLNLDASRADASRAYSSNLRRHLEGSINESKLFFGSHYGSGYHQDGMSRDARQDLEAWPSSALSSLGGSMQHRHASPSIEERWSIHDEETGRRESKRQRSGGAAMRGSVDLGVDRQSYLSMKSQQQQQQQQEYTTRLASLEGGWGEHESSKRYLQGGGGKQSGGYDGGNLDNVAAASSTERIQRSQWLMMKGGSLHWQGVIAKSGTTVCHARCYDIGSALCKVTFPESINCTARTSLDMLAKHINEVGEYSLVAMVPKSEMDVEAYQDFIGYLSEKNRAAVCKLSMECTLFLVPPSDFVELFLKVDRGNSIIGVVLKLHQSYVEQQQQPPPVLHHHHHHHHLQQQPPALKSSELVVSPSPPAPAPAASSSSLLFPHLQYSNRSSAELSFHDSLLPHSSSSSFQPSKPSPSTASASASSILPSSSISLPSSTDDKWLSHHLPSLYASMNQDQHPSSAPLSRALYSFSHPASDLSLPEITTTTSSMQTTPSNLGISSAPLQYTPSSNHQLKDLGQHLQTPSAYFHQPPPPPLPQYPHPSSAQQKLVASSQPSQILPPFQSDQLSQLLSIVAQQTQTPQEISSQAVVQSQQHPANSLKATMLLPNFGHVASSASTGQGFHPQSSQNNPNVIDAEQRELLQLAQQKLSETKGDSSGEDSKRFQATLELAAALLQQLQQKSKS